ncbi:MAG TPA: prephenate dehydrogenase/arogenate dehydrogenase family protein, partial [Anaerolineales bacterium]|nr:prephenate dehydrogenase/arogenate dehydrogenase family protein [Anaerolineales bacterium]
KMEAGFQLQNARIAIVGLGLMGGSLALALKGKCAAIYGIDSDHPTLELALAKKIVDQADADPTRLLPQADLVILATPVLAIIDFIQKLPALIQNPCIILDLGSTKQHIVQAMSTLPERFDPIGGHPICGKEKLGLENADAHLFQNAPFVLISLERTTLRARNAAKQIISTIEARWVEMDAEEHDRALAFTSHLPFLISSALLGALPQEFAGMIGTGFRSTSRLAATPSSMTLGILQSNRENVLNAIQTFQESLSEISSALQAENYTQLEYLLHQSRAAYQSLTEN